MHSRTQSTVWNADRPPSRLNPSDVLVDRLLAVVDTGLLATICVAPFVFGGRHDLGRLAFVSLVGVTAVAWFVRQCVLPQARRPRTVAFGVLLAAIGMVALQLVPMPVDWLAWISPRNAELLPIWQSSGGENFGTWNTLTLAPRETTLALAMLVSYGLLFTVLVQRIETTADVERLLNSVGISAVLMAVFGLVQFFASNGEFFWFYAHPYRSTDRYAMGSFMNRNHFASFLVLGVGPLVRWLVSVVRAEAAFAPRRRMQPTTAMFIKPGLLLTAICIVLLAIALSFSRGGSLALVVATATLGIVYWRWRLVDGKYLYALAGIGLVMLGLLSIYGYEELSGRLNDFTSGSYEVLDRGEGRRKVWAANVEAIKNGGLFGAGAGSHAQICPVYLLEPPRTEFTHAENGYLQIATENGALGVALLVAGIAMIAGWCLGCLRRLVEPDQQLCFGAAVAGLAASVAHSLVDFVWFIPACATLAIVFAASVLRLAQLSLPQERRDAATVTWPRARWLECGTAAALAGLWSIHAFIGPGVGAVSWDRYLRDVVGSGRLFSERLSQVYRRELTESEAAMREPVAESMHRHLQATIRWDPAFARAHLKLAALYVQSFEKGRESAANVMTLQQIRDAAQASTFASSGELRAWLDRAVGADVELIHRANAHARQAVRLSPLEGEAWVLLANLSFLDGARAASTDGLIAQAQRVRPHHGDVIFEIGKHYYTRGQCERGMQEWARCFANPGSHQLRVVNLLAGRLPAREFLEVLRPDWRTLHEVWARYRQLGQPQDLSDLIHYAAQITQRDTQLPGAVPPVFIWQWQASMYADIEREDQALHCLQQAYQCDPRAFGVREGLGYALMKQGRYTEAEPHLRWCLSRRPENKKLSAALAEISRQRLAQRDLAGVPSSDTVTRRP